MVLELFSTVYYSAQYQLVRITDVSHCMYLVSVLNCIFSPLQEMRAAFENEAKQTNRARLLLSAAVSAGVGTIQSAYEIPKVGQ